MLSSPNLDEIFKFLSLNIGDIMEALALQSLNVSAIAQKLKIFSAKTQNRFCDCTGGATSTKEVMF